MGPVAKMGLMVVTEGNKVSQRATAGPALWSHCLSKKPRRKKPEDKGTHHQTHFAQ